MNKLQELVSKLSLSGGLNKTFLPQVRFFKNLESTEKVDLLYKQGVIFMLQGHKCIYTNSHTISYDPHNFLVLTVPMPLKCQAFSIDGEPIIAMLLDIEFGTLNSLIDIIKDKNMYKKISQGDKNKGLFVSDVDQRLRSALCRLLICLRDEIEAKIFGPDIIKEIIYLILKKEEAAPLFALATKNTNLSKIEAALKDVETNYSQPFDVETLARSVNMSISSFHQTFKNVTSSSPIQYLKKVRLSKAREYLVERKLTVSETAESVGYESVSQFNREFKRYFGVTPGTLNK